MKKSNKAAKTGRAKSQNPRFKELIPHLDSYVPLPPIFKKGLQTYCLVQAGKAAKIYAQIGSIGVEVYIVYLWGVIPRKIGAGKKLRYYEVFPDFGDSTTSRFNTIRAALNKFSELEEQYDNEVNID